MGEQLMETVKIEIQNQELKTARNMREGLVAMDMITKAVAWHNLGLRYIGG